MTAQSHGQPRERLALCEAWWEQGGVLIMGYDMYTNLIKEPSKAQAKTKRFKAHLKLLPKFKEYLTSPGQPSHFFMAYIWSFAITAFNLRT